MLPAVLAGLTEARTLEKEGRRVVSLSAWFELRSAQLTSPKSFPITLHRSEREAILLLESLTAAVLLMDKQTVRVIARVRNRTLSGTLGVFERADTIGLLNDLPLVLN